MEEPIESEYFNWLCDLVLESNEIGYNDLLVILHRTEFVWIIPKDRNRADEGVELREYFLRDHPALMNCPWEWQGCSVLEMLIGLAKRAEFQTDIPLKVWFWEFITNLRLEEFRRGANSHASIIDDILYAFIWRQYEPSGYGGIFPISRTNKDQRKQELWYQFCEYVEDRGIL
jgi:hypothetical protein